LIAVFAGGADGSADVGGGTGEADREGALDPPPPPAAGTDATAA